MVWTSSEPPSPITLISWHFADLRLPIADLRLPIADLRTPIADLCLPFSNINHDLGDIIAAKTKHEQSLKSECIAAEFSKRRQCGEQIFVNGEL